MKISHDTNKLLGSLRELLHKVSGYGLLKRINRYHSRTASNRHVDISSSLAKHIEQLVADYKPAEHLPSDYVAPVSEMSNHSHIRSISSLSHQLSPTGHDQDGLANHLKMSTQHEESDLYIGDRLKASTLSHIHAATLQARQGDAEKAKIHADIANQAIKEVAHYLSEEEYKVFCDEVDKLLNSNQVH
ncbi:MAG: hypothetical protein OEY61_10790 [Gammaproteobacteria bacterium]|nr:hypothetical protein [Gammaproteobacteria bacterium]